MPGTTLFLFRNDLRLNDNGALAAACKTDQPLILLYIHDESLLDTEQWGLGSASRWWLHYSLQSLSNDIQQQGGELILRKGETLNIIDELVKQNNVNKLYFSRAYEPSQRKIEEDIYANWHECIEVKRYAGYLLFEPEQIKTGAGLPYKVFTPFWKACLKQPEPGLAGQKHKLVFQSCRIDLRSDAIEDWALLPCKPDWAGGLRDYWQPGEAGAWNTLDSFLETAIGEYDEARNRPDRMGTSRLSPHLHFGEIAPTRVWQQVKKKIKNKSYDISNNGMVFLRELGWRDFSAHLLFHWSGLPDVSFRPEFEQFPWQFDRRLLQAWQTGHTGYPIVDAGMRELWHCGWMHNRVRMIAASFLVKHLLIHWREGEAWFWDTLVDADLANNAASWQWVAGSGADAAPYFRIFNPILQGKKFDPNGDYVRRWVPELIKIPTQYIHEPWQASEAVLKDADVILDESYPKPIVEHGFARDRALVAYKTIKKSG